TKNVLSLGTNWRARIFFNVRKRFVAVGDELKRIQQETGKEPRDLGYSGIDKVRESLKDGHITLFEKAIVRQDFFNSVVGLIVIVVTICYIGAGSAGRG